MTGAVPLTPVEERLWLLEQLQPAAPASHLALVMEVRGPLRADALEIALNGLVARHPALRTRFESADGTDPRATVGPDVVVEVDRVHPVAREVEARVREAEEAFRSAARHPFDLAAGPLLRADLAVIDADRHLLQLVVHRIAADEDSLAVLVDELGALYAGETLPAPGVASPMSPGGGQDIEHWRERLVGVPPSLDIPTDRPRPPVQSMDGARLSWSLPISDAAGIDVLAAYITVLHRYTGTSTIVVGVTRRPRAARGEPFVGPLANTVVVRVDVDAATTFQHVRLTL
jgi:hypothetical protein